MVMQESGEMYLESVLVLSQKGGPVRSLDVARHLGYSKPSISRAMALLRENGYVNIDEHGYITLTDKGTAIANKIYDRHIVLTEHLKQLGVDAKTAEEDACRMEHVISDSTFKALKEHVDKNGD